MIKYSFQNVNDNISYESDNKLRKEYNNSDFFFMLNKWYHFLNFLKL